jgi:hypothetical protein
VYQADKNQKYMSAHLIKIKIIEETPLNVMPYLCVRLQDQDTNYSKAFSPDLVQ